MTRIGIVRERKTPSDFRVPLTPEQCRIAQKHFPVKIVVEPSPDRCFSDKEYIEEGIEVNSKIYDCDFLLGVKEVPIPHLIPNKAYFFFSHTIKKQLYNRKLLQTLVDRNIRMIDYEVLTDDHGRRLIAFGTFAGMVGAHNAVYTYGERTGTYALKRMKDCRDYYEAKKEYASLRLPAMKIVLTGTGRVGNGARNVLRDMGIRQVSPEDFLKTQYSEAVFTQLGCGDYVARKDGNAYRESDYFQYPEKYKSTFAPFAKVSDVMINGIYWDNQAPAFFTKEEMKSEQFRIKVIADVTCDIAPLSSIPSTLRASTIEKPVFGYDPNAEKEVLPFQKDAIDMMTIDNLPNEMPRDASKAFGDQFIEYILEELLKEEKSELIHRATIAKDRNLNTPFEYLRDFLTEAQV